MTSRGIGSILLFILWISILLVPASSEPRFWGPYKPQDETALADDLLQDRKYDKRFRPTTPTYLYIFVMPQSLNKLDIGKQVMSLNLGFLAVWYDWRLAWEPANYSNIEEIFLPYESLWKPPLVVQNSVDSIVHIGSDLKLKVKVTTKGQVLQYTPLFLETFCEMKSLAFPFDTQTCLIYVAVWDTHLGQVAFGEEDGEDSMWNAIYQRNGEWDMVDRFHRVSEPVVFEGKKYARLEMGFNFRRKWVFLTLTLVVPAILNSLLMSAVFALPFECGEKVSYALTVLLTYIVLLTLVTSSLPPISIEISVLQIYLTGVMCTGTVATLLTCWTVTIYSRSPDIPRPHYLAVLCSYVRPLLCKSHTSRNMTADDDLSPPGNEPSNKTHGHHSYDDSRLQQSPFMMSRGLRADPTAHPSDLGAQKYLRPNGIQNANFGNRHGANHYNHYEDDDTMYSFSLKRTNFKRDQDTHNGRAGSREQSIQHSKSSEETEDISWVVIAETIDAIFLRIISFLILASTLGLVIFLAISY